MVDIIRRKERRGTDAEWSSLNEVLGDGEIGYSKDSSYFKLGDGVTAWNSLVNKYEAALAGVYNLRAAGNIGSALSYLAGGGLLDAPRGILSVPGDHPLPSASIWRGKGSSQYGTFLGTVYRLNQNGKPIFKITGGQSNIKLIDMALDCADKTGATCVDIVKGTGGGASPTFNLTFQNIEFTGGEYGIRVRDPAHVWQVTGVAVINCNFLLQTIASIEIDTANQRFYALGNSFTPDVGADALYLKYSATSLIANNTFNGFDIANPKTHDWTFTSSDVDTTNNKITKTGVLSVTGDPIYFVTTGTLPGNLTLAQRFFVRKNGNDYYCHYTPQDALNAVNTIPLPSGGSGTHTARAISNLKAAGRPRACLATQGQNGMISLINNEAEGMAYFCHLSGNDDVSHPITLINNLPQAAMKFNSSYTMLSIGNNYMLRSFLDEYGVRSKITSIGDKAWTPDGLGATYYDCSQTVTPPYPWQFSNFKGNSEIDIERDFSFVPSDLDETIIMLEGDYYYQADGSNVTTAWGDFSKRKGNASVAGTPTFETNELNGLPVIRLGADSNDTIDLPAHLAGYRWYYCFEVLKVNTTNDAGHTWGTDLVNHDHYVYGDGNVYSNFATTARKSCGAPDIGVTNWHLSEFCSGPGYWGWWQNGVLQFDTNTNIVAWPTAAKLGVSNSVYMKTDLASFILLVGHRRLEIGKIRKIRDYIKDKWNVG